MKVSRLKAGLKEHNTGNTHVTKVGTPAGREGNQQVHTKQTSKQANTQERRKEAKGRERGREDRREGGREGPRAVGYPEVFLFKLLFPHLQYDGCP